MLSYFSRFLPLDGLSIAPTTTAALSDNVVAQHCASQCLLSLLLPCAQALCQGAVIMLSELLSSSDWSTW